ncbi:hypothetical protein F8A87_12965 [Betaproteobacteria bacterium SCN2]|jgi:hypothetical protein|nr:hypothetical protein F8A87_12965 [Betaproteobacteria bacterium SCN2]
MRRALHAFLLVFAFLFSQAGLSAHAVSHLAAERHGSEQGVPPHAACDLCVGYAQLAGTAPMPVPPALPDCAARHEVPETHAAVQASRAVIHAHARAPPVFS